MKPETMNIIKMISKPVSERMPFEGVQITKFVQKLTFFKRYFPYQSQKFISLCLSSILMTFKPGEYLYQHEHENQPNNIYILIDGNLQLKSTQHPSCRTINTYDIIGHVEVIFRLERRYEKVKCLSDIHCMVIKGDNFHEVWQYETQINKSYSYIKSNKYFEALTDFNKKYLSLFMIKNMFKNGQILIHSNGINEKILFIIYGEIFVTRKLKVKNNKEKESEKEVVIECLQEMDSFGEYQAIKKLVNQVSLRAASSGMYYTINIGEILEVNHPIIQIMQEKGMPYPDKQELEFRFSVQSEVEKYKNQVKKKLRLYE